MLIAGGDSWACWPQEQFYGSRDKCWPSIVSKKLNLQLIDNSRAGCSNDRIFRYCLPSVLENSKSTVVIFWTCSDRFEVGFQGKINQVQPSNPDFKMIPKTFLQNFDLYLQYVNTLLYTLSIQEVCKSKNSVLLQKFTFRSDCWWDYKIESFKKFLRDAGTFDYLSDEQIFEKFYYLEKLHSNIDSWLGPVNESLQDLIETSDDFLGHPTDNGHKQMANLILNCLQ